MGELHVFFFPVMAHGHTIPMIDMAKLFASRGVKATIITTPANAPLLTKTIQRSKISSGIHISIQLINFPWVEAGLPEGCERLEQLPSNDLFPNYFNALRMLREPLDRVLREARPDCLVADMFYPWATHVAAQLDIPRLVFHGTGFFALSASEHLRVCKPQRNVSSDSEPFIIPNLPHEVKLTRTQLPDFDREEDMENDFSRLLVEAMESELTSYGVIVNSFYELESAYADHYREGLGRKAWHIGPVSLCNTEIEDKAQRGYEAAIGEQECLKWLDSKKPNSVIYICFGSAANFTDSQLHELAMGIEGSGQQFIWVVRKTMMKNGDEKEGKENWLPEGFEERTETKGMIIRGWAPQVLILDHEAVGGFVTHCGWNSILEGVSAGVPMVTWPVFAEQFLNEKLLTEIQRIGVGVGARQWQWHPAECEGVKREEIERAVKQVMVGEEAEELRNRAKRFKEMANKAIEEGGTSYNDLNALIHELNYYHS